MSVQIPAVVDVTAYAAAVRRALADLGPDQVEELTDGLEANLADALADEWHVGHGADPVAQFGGAEQYAAELRTAAGLAPAGPDGRQSRLAALRHPLRAAGRAGARRLTQARATRWWPAVEDFGVALRPAWWVLRGWMAYQLVALWVFRTPPSYLPETLWAAVVLAALLVASVQWGRGRWAVRGGWRTVLLTVSALTAVAALPMAVWLHAASTQYVYVDMGGPVAPAPQDGVVVDGIAVSNLFVYDAEGNPLRDVQIYDDRGRPVRTTLDEGQAPWALPGVNETWSFVPATDGDGRALWNVYPLRGAPQSAFVWDEATGRQLLPAGTEAVTPPWPFAKAPTLDVTPQVGVDTAGLPSTDPGDDGATPSVEASPSAGAPPQAPQTPAAG